LGKQENCRVAVSLSVSTAEASLPIAFDLYLPEMWILDSEARKKTGVPEDVEFRTKPLIAIEQVGQALRAGVPRAPVLADAAYGSDAQFREALEALGCEYVVGIASTLTFWPPGEQPLPALPGPRTGRPAKLLRRSAEHQPAAAAQLASQLPRKAWKTATWRQGTKQPLRSRFAALRVRSAHRGDWRSGPWPEQWLLIEWPAGNEAVFPPLPAPDSSHLPCPPGHPDGNPEGRAQRHNPHSIATLRELAARYLLTRLPSCLFCGAFRL
jgi:SRSO17 transposase